MRIKMRKITIKRTIKININAQLILFLHDFAVSFRTDGNRPQCKRRQTALQKAVFDKMKGRLSQDERRPFASH